MDAGTSFGFFDGLAAVGSETYLHAVYAVLSILLIGAYLRNTFANRNARTKLRDVEALMEMQKAVADAHCMISATDPEGRVTFANEKFLKATGYGADEILGMPVSSFYATSNAEVRAAMIRSQVRENGIWSGEMELRCKSGALIWTHTTVKAMLDKWGRPISIVSLRTDITASKRAQSDRQLRNIFDLLPDEVYVFNAETLAFTYVNQTVLRNLGIAAGQVAMRKIGSVPGFLSSPEFRALIDQLRHSDTPLSMTRQHEGERVLDVTLQVIRTDDQADLFFVMARDITAHAQTERAKAEFVATVSHELRTPLTSIKGALGLLTSGAMGKFSEAAAAILTMAQRNTERLILLINDLLDLEKLDAGQMDLTRAPCDLCALVTDVAEMTTGYALQFGVRIDVRLPHGSAVVEGNRDRLIQVLVNLVSNAVKFTPQGETVVVELSGQGDCYRVSVADKGPGVPDELKTRIFERFSQAKTGTANGTGVAGTGLGLSISKAIIERHDGIVDFRPGTEGGTVFYFDLPKHRNAMAA